MSLIADALKAAQREKAKHAAANGTETKPSFFAVNARTETRRKLNVDWRRLALPVTAVAVLLGAGWGLNALLRNDGRREGDRAQLVVDTAAVNAPAATGPAEPYFIEELDGPAEDINDVPVAEGPRAFPPRRMPPPESIEPTQTPEPSRSTAPAVNSGGLRIEVQQPALVGANPLIAQALAAYTRRDYTAARDFYERALASGVASPDIYNNLGTVYRNLGDLARAEQAYQSAIALNPRSASAWSNLGVVLYTLGRKREATAAYQEAIRLDPANASTKVNLAILFVEGAVHTEARKLLEEALATAPGLPEAHYTFAQLLESMKDNAGAVRHYEQFLTSSAGRFPDLERRVRTRLEALR